MKISIITASYNSEKYLQNAIESVMSQTYSDIEYVIVDGASRDRTLEIVSNYGHHIHKLISEPDDGVYDAFNKGIRAATGDVIYFLNSDDQLYSPDTIAEVAAIFSQQPDLDFLYANVMVEDSYSGQPYIAGKELRFEDFKTGEMCPHQGVFVKKNLFAKHGGFCLDYRIASDFDFVLKCFGDQEVNRLYVNQIIARFRDGGISSNPHYRERLTAEKKRILESRFGKTEFGEGEDTQGLFRIWLEVLLLKKKNIFSAFSSKGYKNIVIFGTRKVAMYLYEDLSREQLNVSAFLDNNENMQGRSMNGVLVYGSDWLVEHRSEVDAVVVSIESSHDSEVIEALEEMTNGQVPIVSWKELVNAYQ